MTADLLPIEIETGSDPRHCVIWMHGLGADGNDFVPVVEELDLPRVPIRFVFPHAPMQPVTINGGYVMRAWYDIGYQDLSLREDERGVRDSQHSIEALIERESERGIGPEQLLLAGFSQGGAIALQTALRYPARLAGVHGAVHLSAAPGQAGERAQRRQPGRPDPHGARHRGPDRAAQARAGLPARGC